jgi:Alpha/beta hydrolase domain
VYVAKDPLVLGIGMAANRDLFSWLRYGTLDDSGNRNPIAGKMQWGIGYGISQSGRYLKTFILDGFNEDEEGRIVYDGAHPIIAGSMGQFNVRFAQPGNIALIFEAGAEGPIWWGEYNDRARGRGVTSLLQRCKKTHTCPKVVDDFGGPEMWYTRGGVGIIGTDGIHGHDEIELPHNVRRYYNAGTTHGGGGGGFARVQPAQNNLLLASNPNPETETRRALIVARDAWVMKGVKPPKSSYPSPKDGTLVEATARAMHWPTIPGAPTPDDVINPVLDYDWGASFRYNDQAGIETNVVPRIKQAIPTPGSKVDEDGNELGGVKSVLLQAPLGTYTAWNPVASGPLKGNEGNLAAGYIPFAQTRAERLAAGDPRLSVEERYGSQEGYNCVVSRAAERNVHDRYLLPGDATRLIAQAAASNVLPSDPNNATAKRLCNARPDPRHDDNDDDDA